MGKLFVSPERAAELGRLNAELLLAQQRVTDAFQTHGRPLKGRALARLMDEERKVSVISRQIRDLLKGE
jgi:hypothetical protein